MTRTLFSLLLVACAHQPSGASVLSDQATPKVTLTYLGVAGWQLAGKGTLLVDPYVTRVNVKDDSIPISSDERAIAKYTPSKADAILVTHSHYDHILDVPYIARRTQAVVVGTESTKTLMLAFGHSRVRAAKGGEEFALGPFLVQPVESAHSLTGQDNEPIKPTVRWPLSAKDLGEGNTLQYLVTTQGLSVYFVGTANFVESALVGLRPDVAVVAVGLRKKVPDYTCRLLRALHQPRLVIPNHFDDFKTRLDDGGTSLDEGTRKDLDDFAQEVHRCSPKTRVQVPMHFAPIVIDG